jgi:cbb3-type cytochrome oxidase subunit 3
MIQQLMNALGAVTEAKLVLLLFVGYFFGMILWVFHPGRKKSYNNLSDLPFEKENIHD